MSPNLTHYEVGKEGQDGKEHEGEGAANESQGAVFFQFCRRRRLPGWETNHC